MVYVTDRVHDAKCGFSQANATHQTYVSAATHPFNWGAFDFFVIFFANNLSCPVMFPFVSSQQLIIFFFSFAGTWLLFWPRWQMTTIERKTCMVFKTKILCERVAIANC